MRDSTMGDATRIGAGRAPKQVRGRLIRGKTELLPGMDIIKKLGLTVNFGGSQFKVGQVEW